MREYVLTRIASRQLALALLVLSALVLSLGCAGKKQLVDQGATPAPEPAVEASQPEAQTETPEPEGALSGEAEEVLLLDSVHFAFDKFDLTVLARGILAGHARLLRNRPELAVTIAGHCDERGTIEYNLALGEKRAWAVKNYLSALGIAGARLNTISYGKERPLQEGHNETVWAKNRRAEFSVTKQYTLN